MRKLESCIHWGKPRNFKNNVQSWGAKNVKTIIPISVKAPPQTWTVGLIVSRTLLVVLGYEIKVKSGLVC